MSRITTNNERYDVKDLDAGTVVATALAASAGAVSTVLAASENDEDGRSEWVWLWLPNGDLVLATFPQGDTYCATETDHSR